MPISLHLDANTPLELLSDLRDLFPGLGLPPMQEQPAANREPLPAENVKEVEAPRRTRRTKAEMAAEKEAAEGDKGESAPVTPETSDSSTASSSAASTDQQSDEPSKDAEQPVPDIEDLRARLKTLGATEGFGTDKVFEVLGKYGAKNASTVPEEKRAACIAEIDGILAGAK